MQNKLLPCPFCGGEAVVLSYDNGFNNWFQVVCKECNVSQTGSDNWTKNNAIEHWNTRKPMERIVEQLEEIKGRYSKEEFGIRGIIQKAIEIVKGGVDNAE